ncbi:MAG TPA: hypothetical protein VFH21_04200 [Burkholderiales bacterium]|nr:hypothetical protein [Burkholderiales bacterium]
MGKRKRRSSLWHSQFRAALLVTSAAFSADGRFLIAASADNTARVWEAGTWRNLAALRGHNDDVVQAKLSADEKTAITASYDATVRIWDASAWQTRSAKPH